MSKKFKTTALYDCIKINKGENEITIKKDLDNNIWFTGNNNQEMSINFNVSSFDYAEFKTYHIFYNLIKSILGKYILQDYKKYHNDLPSDFINLEKKEIICHSDSNGASYLKLKLDNSCLSVSVIKEMHLDSTVIQNSVEIINHNSKYGNYHSEFENFYNNLYTFNHSIKKENSYQKRLQK